MVPHTKVFKRKVGRPPAAWMQKISKLELVEDKILTKEELCRRFDASPSSVGNFCSKHKLVGEYRRDGENIIVCYSLKAFQTAVRKYIASRSA